MRLFAALEVPEAICATLAAATRDLRADDRVRWTAPEGWHLTVAFIGETDLRDDAFAALAEVAAAAGGAIHLRLGAATRRGDRLLWLDVDDEPAGAVQRLGAHAQDALAAAGVPVDRKAARGHLTLARGRGGRGRITPALAAAVLRVTGEWDATDLVLLSSHQAGPRTPNRYEVEGSWALRPALREG